MSQSDLFNNDEANRWVLISLHPEPYREVCEGSKKFEYRRGAFLKGPAKAFVYCTMPVKETGLFVELGKPIVGDLSEIAVVKEQEVSGSYDTMMDWLAGAKKASATPIEKPVTFPPISLIEIKAKFPKFHPPQRFIYLDKSPEILRFIKHKSGIFEV